ncbi:MAG: VOC family protein [Anaerolineae bacterium]|nr:VOC family protein [Anaerolineae bacterium]
MEKVVGIGGFFFRSKNPQALAEWYEKNLGINQSPQDYNAIPWQQQAGITIFAPFEESTDYFGRASQQWMINFRVQNLDAMVAQLRANGITVTVDDVVYPNGRFAQLNDPEGNPIQLWEPMNPQ